MTKPRSGTLSIILLPRTEAGRGLLRDLLPFAHDPNRRDGELPDGSSIYDTDFDKLAVELERDYDDFLESYFTPEDEDRGGV